MARDAERLTAVVVFPTPPFWLAMAIILAIYVSSYLTMSYAPRCRNRELGASEGESIYVVQEIRQLLYSSCCREVIGRTTHEPLRNP
jgi:hypothetical protein